MSTLIKIKPTASSRVVPPEAMAIDLTNTESNIYTLLDECTQYLKKDKALDTSCRVAGGWVRDKVNREHSNGEQDRYVYIHIFLLYSCWDRRAMISISHLRI